MRKQSNAHQIRFNSKISYVTMSEFEFERNESVFHDMHIISGYYLYSCIVQNGECFKRFENPQP